MRGAPAAMTALEALGERLLPRPEGKCLLGLSGGADSVGLLHLLLPLREEGSISLEAIHVNHGLRGEASDGDEAFVRELCERQRIRLHTVSLDLRGKKDENSARTARYAAYRQVLAAEGIPTLILAHQREDQAETFLMRLLRGAGPEGLGGMRAAEERNGYTLLRPMLDISGRELRDALREAGIPWREDGSNRDGAYLRNRIRMELIPLMEQTAPGAAGRIARTAGLIALENDAMAAEAERALAACREGEELNAEKLSALPQAVRTRALRRWWRIRGPVLEERELSYEQTGRLEGLTASPRGTIINLPGGWRARREKETIRLMDPASRTKNNRPKRKGDPHD